MTQSDEEFDWLEFGRAVSGVIVVSGLVALSVLTVYRDGEGPALVIMLFYASLALVLFGLKNGLDMFGGGGRGPGGNATDRDSDQDRRRGGGRE